MAPLSYGNYSSSRVREISTCDIKVSGISAPSGGQSLGSPLYVTYKLQSDVLTPTSDLDVDYSDDDGSTWNTCTADATDPLHEGKVGLTTSADGISHTFVWNSASDLTTKR